MRSSVPSCDVFPSDALQIEGKGNKGVKKVKLWPKRGPSSVCFRACRRLRARRMGGGVYVACDPVPCSFASKVGCAT
jgi:hypothetical protein